jgi:hypothetical protein
MNGSTAWRVVAESFAVRHETEKHGKQGVKPLCPGLPRRVFIRRGRPEYQRPLMRCDLPVVIAITPATLARTASRPCNTGPIDVLRLTRRVVRGRRSATSPRLRGEVDARSAAGEGALQQTRRCSDSRRGPLIPTFSPQAGRRSERQCVPNNSPCDPIESLPLPRQAGISTPPCALFCALFFTGPGARRRSACYLSDAG